MKKSISLVLATGLLSMGLGAVAQDNMAGDKPMMKSDKAMTMTMKAMDTNGDGMVSKAEFMKYHEDMYTGMHPNADGMVDIRPMTKKQSQMMMGGKPMSIDMVLMGAKSDGTVSRAQYMKYHENMYNGMEMNKDSMVDMKTMMMK